MSGTRDEPAKTAGASPTDLSRDLPLVLAGVFEPHSVLDAVEWVEGWSPPGPSNGGGAAAMPLDPTTGAPLRPKAAASAVPPLPRPPRAAPPPTPEVAVALGGATLPNAPVVDETSIDQSEPSIKDEVDALMADIMSADDDSVEAARRVTRGEWYAEVFDQTYLRLLPSNFYQRTLDQVDFIESMLGLDGSGEILDLACGYGRHTVELAARGYELVGVDKALSLLERGLQEAQKRSLAIKFVLGDMRELAFEAAFDAVISMHTSFGYFDDASNRAVLLGIFESLRPGGALLLEQVNRDWVIGYCPKRTWWEADGLLVMEDVGFDHRTSRLQIERSVVDETQTPWEQHIEIRLYAVHEICAVLQSVGFEIESVTGDFAHPGAYVGPGNRQVIVVARKPTAPAS